MRREEDFVASKQDQSPHAHTKFGLKIDRERMSGVGKVVCVTGASGYIPSWLVKLLLQRGYTVKATFRNLSDPNKVAHLKELEGAEERLHLFEANLMGDGSFDPAVRGCEGVFHTASPAILEATDPQAELIEPAVKGTLNVLKSCSKIPSVRRVVLTSSLAAVMFNRSLKGHNVIIDETWFSDPVFCDEIKSWYCLSKTLAEEAAWVFSKQNGIDLVVMNPSYVIGPILQPTLNFTSKAFLNLIKENKAFPWPSYQLVDVRDVAQAHIVAFENPSASGRYILMERELDHSETMEILQKLYPSLNLPKISTAGVPTYRVCNKRAQDLGVIFTPSEVSLKDMVESLKEKNFLT